jgi:hypothetical protein
LMGAKLPSGTSIFSLLGVALLTGVYIYVDHDLRVEDRMQLLWLSIWLSTLTYQVRFLLGRDGRCFLTYHKNR